MTSTNMSPPAILLIDDNVDVLYLLQRMLRQIVPGHYALIVNTAPGAALTQLTRHTVALLIADYQLNARIDGAQLCATVKTASPRTTTILISASLPTHRADLVRIPADYILRKPLIWNDLLRVVEAALVDAT